VGGVTYKLLSLIFKLRKPSQNSLLKAAIYSRPVTESRILGLVQAFLDGSFVPSKKGARI
jgi:hypothetical protein